MCHIQQTWRSSWSPMVPPCYCLTAVLSSLSLQVTATCNRHTCPQFEKYGGLLNGQKGASMIAHTGSVSQRPGIRRPSGACTGQTPLIGLHKTRKLNLRHHLCAVSAPTPCIVLTSTSSTPDHSLHELADRVRQQLSLEAVVVTPVPAAASSSTSSSCSTGATAAATEHLLSFGRQLQVLPQPQHGVYQVAGATAADCVLCAVDAKAGLLASLGLCAALVVVGVHRGHALGSDVDVNPAVCVARQSAQLGVPSIATCLATTSPAASLQPALEATLQLVQQALSCLISTNSSWPMPANYPRAHFPFPEAGRWALGKELPLPQSSSSSSHGSAWQPADCWALAEDNSWAGRYSSGKQAAADGTGSGSRSTAEAANILRRAFADGDILLCLNVPPNWQSPRTEQQPAVFASTRPGVLWHCYQVRAEGLQAAAQQQPWSRHAAVQGAVVSSQPQIMAAAAAPPAAASPAGVSSSRESLSREGTYVGRWEAAGLRLRSSDRDHGCKVGSSSPASWQSTAADLYGRSLPSTSFGASQSVVTGAFVSQDNTEKVISAARRVDHHGDHQALGQVPYSFVIQQGTLLSDHATAGDVEAVFSGRAAVGTLQTWPVGHPLSLRDDVLSAALCEDSSGLPAWLTRV